MHCEQKSLTDAYFEELQKSITREKAMGPPKQIVPRDIVPSKVAIAPCTLAVAEGDLKKRAGRSNLMDADTLRSTIPMKMPVRGVNRSTYSVRVCCFSHKPSVFQRKREGSPKRKVFGSIVDCINLACHCVLCSQLDPWKIFPSKRIVV